MVFASFYLYSYGMQTQSQEGKHPIKPRKIWFTLINKLNELRGKEAFIYKESPELLEEEEKEVVTSYYYGYLSRALPRYKLFKSSPVFYYDRLKVILPGEHQGFLFSGEKASIFNEEAYNAIAEDKYITCEKAAATKSAKSPQNYSETNVIIANTQNQELCRDLVIHAALGQNNKDDFALPAVSSLDHGHPYSVTPVFSKCLYYTILH